MPDTNPLSVTIGGKEYTLPPVGWEAGTELTRYFTMTDAQLGKVKRKAEELYELALGADVWAQMKTDGADFILMNRAGLAALGHFQARLRDLGDDRAREIFDGIIESGVDPEALAARAAANLAGSTTSPATPPRARTSSMKSPASTASTRSRKAEASRSSGRTSSPRKT